MIVDTSFLVSFFVKEDINHEKAVNIIKELDEDLVIPITVLGETFTVLNYKKGIDFALKTIELLTNSRNISIYYFDEDEFDEIFDIVRKLSLKLSFEDYSIVYLARLRNESLLCFDKEIYKAIKK